MYDPNVCTPTMFEDELRALAAMPAFADPDIEARLDAVGQLKRAIEAVREIPGWGGDSVGEAQSLLERMEKGAIEIERALRGMKVDLRAASDIAAGAAAEALRGLPSASAEGLLADAGRMLSGVTDGLGALDTGEAVAREEARLAAERETAAMNELKKIRGTLADEARQDFTDPGRVQVNPSSVPLPSIDVEAIDARVPAVGSNVPASGGSAPSTGGSGGYPQGGAGIDSWNPPTGTWVPGGNGNGDGDGNGNGAGNGNENGNGAGGGDGNGAGDGNGNGNDGPNVDSPGGGILPGYPGGIAGGGGAGGGLLPGGGSSGLAAAVASGAGAAAMLGARSASLNAAGGAGLFGGGGSGAGAATAGRGLLGMSGATVPGGMGMTGPASGSAPGAVAGSTAGAGGRSMAPGMMGTGAGDDEKRERSGLGGPIAPKLEDDEEVGPRSRSAQAGSRSALD